jgi:hypothetical protein
MKLNKQEFFNLIKEEVKSAINSINEEHLINEGKTKKKKPSAGLTAKQKSKVVKKAKKGEDIGKKGKGFEDVVAKAKEWGAKDPEAVAGAAMWKNIKRGK